MTNHNQQGHYARELLESLTDTTLPLIDFDQMKNWLTESAALLDQVANLSEELHLLREDYLSRIGGMVKAIAVARRQPHEWEQTLSEIDELGAMTAPELIATYRKASARFRDTFAASFTLPRQRGRDSASLRDAVRVK